MKYFRLLLPVLEAIAVTVFVFTLFPIIFGLGEDAQWSFPLRIIELAPVVFFAFLGGLMFLAVLLTFIPKVKRLRSLKTLVLGVLSLVFVRFFLNVLNPGIEIGFADLFPGVSFILGISVVIGVITVASMYISGAVQNLLGNKFNVNEGTAELLVLPHIALLGFIPVFMYGAWLA